MHHVVKIRTEEDPLSLRGVAVETLSFLERGAYESPAGEIRALEPAQSAAVAGTVVHAPEELDEFLARPAAGGAAPRVEVRDGTTQAVAQALVQDEGERVLLLNFASARNAGGGFVNGARAQEEDVCRCSGLYPCLLRAERYYRANRATSSMLYTDHVVYSPDVPFFRTRARDRLERPFLASVLTAPAPNAGQHLARRPDGALELDRALRRRAGLVLAAMRAHGHRTLLLGAWGCGVFRNDPARVADAFCSWLEGQTFAGDFDRVVFGVWDRHGATLAAFRSRCGRPA